MSDLTAFDPLLKWAGGKRWLLPRLRELYDPSRRLVDPFLGGAAVSLGLAPRQALVCDYNVHLMNFYRWIQAGLEWDDNCGIEFENDPYVFYENRSKFNALIYARDVWCREAALLFYYLNRTGFNGLCRFNSNGYYNVPFGRYKYISYERNFQHYRPPLSNWQLFYGDFESLPLQAGDFIYADPPYDVDFTQFSSRDFTWGDQERLAKWLARHQGPVIASNQATPRVVQLYRDLRFEVYSVEAPRAIAANGDRTPAVEMLAIKRA